MTHTHMHTYTPTHTHIHSHREREGRDGWTECVFVCVRGKEQIMPRCERGGLISLGWCGAEQAGVGLLLGEQKDSNIVSVKQVDHARAYITS